jgi:hypothetical protein
MKTFVIDFDPPPPKVTLLTLIRMDVRKSVAMQLGVTYDSPDDQ